MPPSVACVAAGCAQGLPAVPGTVQDTAGAPIPGAVVAVAHGRVGSVLTGASGAFVIRVPGAARLVAARIGFTPQTLAVSASLVLALTPAAVHLEPIVVGAERAFTAASASSIGDLDVALRPRASSRALLQLVPGPTTVPTSP